MNLNEFPYDKIQEPDLYHSLKAKLNKLSKHEIFKYAPQLERRSDPYSRYEIFQDFVKITNEAIHNANELLKRAKQRFPDDASPDQTEKLNLEGYKQYPLAELFGIMSGTIEDLRSHKIFSWDRKHRKPECVYPIFFAETIESLKKTIELSRFIEDKIQSEIQKPIPELPWD